MNTTEQRRGWTEERVSTLRKLWAEGMSASMIAARLGGASRNAVIGKAHRLRLASRETTTRQRVIPSKRQLRLQRDGLRPSGPPKIRIPKSPVLRLDSMLTGQWLTKTEPLFKESAVVHLPQPPDHTVGPIPHELLKPHHCQYPFGDRAPWTFCDAKPDGKSRYCAKHHALCTQRVARWVKPAKALPLTMAAA